MKRVNGMAEPPPHFGPLKEAPMARQAFTPMDIDALDAAHRPYGVDGVTAQNAALKTLLALPVADAIGAACSYLLHAAYNHREVFRRVMNERVVRDGFSGISLLTVFNRVSK